MKIEHRVHLDKSDLTEADYAYLVAAVKFLKTQARGLNLRTSETSVELTITCSPTRPERPLCYRLIGWLDDFISYRSGVTERAQQAMMDLIGPPGVNIEQWVRNPTVDQRQ